MTPTLRFTVYGTPQPTGSKKSFGSGHVVDANPKSRPWKNQVAQVAGETMAGRSILDGPLFVSFKFYRARPKDHRGKNGLTAKGKRTPYPHTRPDVLKLARGVEDALTGVIWTDDALIVDEVLMKQWGTPERVEVEVWDLAPGVAEREA
jgi:Holliday junction resolvase RusA-like endonuclease